MNFTAKETRIILEVLQFSQLKCYCFGVINKCTYCKETEKLYYKIKADLARQNQEPQMMCGHGQNFGTCSFGCKLPSQENENKE